MMKSSRLPRDQRIAESTHVAGPRPWSVILLSAWPHADLRPLPGLDADDQPERADAAKRSAHRRYLIEIPKPCNTYPDEIRIAHDQELQGEVCRANPSGPHGPEGFSGKSRQGGAPKADYAGRGRLSCGLELASRKPP